MDRNQGNPDVLDLPTVSSAAPAYPVWVQGRCDGRSCNCPMAGELLVMDVRARRLASDRPRPCVDRRAVTRAGTWWRLAMGRKCPKCGGRGWDKWGNACPQCEGEGEID